MRTRALVGAAMTLLLTACYPDAKQITDLPEPMSTSQTADDLGSPSTTAEAIPGTVASAEGLAANANEVSSADIAMRPEPRTETPDAPVYAQSGPSGGINPLVTETGFVSLSVDGLGVYPGNSGTVQVQKPVGATVRGAYMAAASTWGRPAIPNGAITLAGHGVNWQQTVHINPPYSHWADVTQIVKPVVDGAAPGIVNIGVSESDTYGVDGSILAVIFDDPNQTTENTVSLLFGGQKIAGDDFYLGLAEPVDLSDPGLRMDMSLGISFGYQSGSYGTQHSTIDVNGQRLTTSAGGQDDGAPYDGALLTVGGVGDTNANPANPSSFCGNGPRCDDELYNLIPYVSDGTQVIQVHTVNPSNDDNLFFAAFFLSVAAEVVTEDPVANAGPDQELEGPSAMVSLDGSASFDPDGHIVSYEWFMNPADPPFATGPVPPTFSLPTGEHHITLKVTDNDGLTDSDEVIVNVVVTNLPPVPAIIHNCPAPYYEGGPTCLNGGPTYDPPPGDDVSQLLFEWDFGDGTTHSQLGVQGMPNKVYADDGIYTVTLKVTDTGGLSATTTLDVEVLNVPPKPTLSPMSTVLTFDASSGTGAFFDPGADDWTGEVDYGDGTVELLTLNPDHTFQLAHAYDDDGVYTVTVTIRDDDGGEGSATTTATILNRAPVAVPGGPYIAQCTDASLGGTSVNLDGSASHDPDGQITVWEWSLGGNHLASGPTPTVSLLSGTYTASLEVTDDDGATGKGDATIEVVDTEDPVLSFGLDVTELWSPNHKMVTVATGISASDACDSSVSLHFAVTSSEPINDIADGNTEPDWMVVDNGDGTFDLQLRSERQGTGTDRIYTILVTATDATGHQVEAMGTVTVPHDQGKGKGKGRN